MQLLTVTTKHDEWLYEHMFDDYWREVGCLLHGEGNKIAAKSAFIYAVEMTAKQCKLISQQRYLSIEQAVQIDRKISETFCV